MSLPQSVKRWAFYNFANHSYQVVYVSFLFPVFFSTVLLTKGYSLSAWGGANGIATLIGVAIAVIIGKYSDKHGKLKAFKWSVLLSCLGMFILAFGVSYFPALLYWLFVATQAIFIWSLALSDSILPHISTSDTAYEYGGFAWGFGYLGGIASLIVALVLQRLTSDYSLSVFLSVPIFYILFSWYSISGLKQLALSEPVVNEKKDIISRKDKGKLFLGYWLISECITVISLFASIYLSKEMHFSTVGVGAALLLAQLIGFPATWYGGKLVNRYGTIRLLGVTIILWGISLGILLLLHFGLVGVIIAIILLGMAYGNSQSYLRSQYSTIIERNESGFQFGIYSVISEASVFIGPVAYGFASDRLHSQKIPLLSLFVLMVVGYYLIRAVTKNISRPKMLVTSKDQLLG